MLTMIQPNPALVVGDMLRVDRKFHVGMLKYCQAIRAPIVTVHLETGVGKEEMDTIEVRSSEIPYGVIVLKTNDSGEMRLEQRRLLEEQISRSTLVYGMGMGSEALAQFYDVPYIMILETDLLTQIILSRTQVVSPLRKMSRTLKVTWKYFAHTLPRVRRAMAIHCNGYPIHDAMSWVSRSRLLYLDSRMAADLVISEEALATRLATRSHRPLKLLYSGRYEKLKGAVDAVKVGISAVNLGLDIEMHCYGSGSQAMQMKRLVDAASMAKRIHIHAAVSFPELISLAKDFDIFVCCHIQSDPSCTYLESFGAGLPIVGYGNRMWRRLSEESNAGAWSPIGKPETVAGHLRCLMKNTSLLDEMSRRARSFALKHCFENEFGRRTEALNQALVGTKPSQPVTAGRL